MKALEWISDFLKKVGGICLVGMMSLTCADVIGRIFGHPILGSVELVTVMATMAIAMGLAFTHETKGHVGVEILVRLLSQRAQTIIELCTSTLSFLLFTIITWRMFLYAHDLHRTGEETVNLKLPEYIFVYILSACLIVFTLTILRDLISNIRKLGAR